MTDFYDRLLRSSFTPDQSPEDDYWLLEALRDGAGEILAEVLVSEDGTVVAGAVAEPLNDAGVLLLGYLATRPGWRSAGLGERALRDIVWPRTAATGCRFTIGEVADPRVHVDDPYADACVRFYGGHGAKAAAVPHFQPRLVAGTSPRVRRAHGVIASQGDLTETDIATDTVRTFEQYVTQTEGAGALEDPDVRSYLKEIGTGRVPLVPIEEYERVPLGIPPSG